MKEELNIMIEQDKKDVLMVVGNELFRIVHENNSENRNWQEDVQRLIVILKDLIEYDHQDLPA